MNKIKVKKALILAGERHDGKMKRHEWTDHTGKKSGYDERTERFDMHTAEKWMHHLKNDDGTTGPHWTMDQVKQVAEKHGMKYDLHELWAVMNSIYSDYCEVAKKHGTNNLDFYADMTRAWLDDADAVENKAAAYYDYVVKR